MTCTCLVRATGTLLFLSVLMLCQQGIAAEAVAGEAALLSKYHTLEARLEKNQFGTPIYLESTDTQDSVRVDLYGIFRHPFAAVAQALQSPANWCEITPLHINVKACTSRKSADQWLVTLYNGRKHYQPPSDAYPLHLKFNIISREPRYFHLSLAADEGPMHTRNHRMRVEAVPVDDRRTLVHFVYSYSQGAMTRMAVKSYFSTLGRDKVGFSVVPGEGGKAVNVSGVRGAVERNSVRYYLALQAYIDTLHVPEGRRFEERALRWYELTSRYPRQLKELDRQEYLSSKRQERRNQVALQRGEGK